MATGGEVLLKPGVLVRSKFAVTGGGYQRLEPGAPLAGLALVKGVSETRATFGEVSMR